MSGYSFNSSIRQPQHQRPRWSLAGFALLCALGCGEGPKAEFGWRQSTHDLIPAANKAVKQVMTDDFGTPQDLVGWERLPVDYGGGVRASVATADKGSLILALTDPKHADEIHPGQSIQWLTGSQAVTETKDKNKDKQKIIVAEFDPKTLQLTASGGGGAAGDQLLIGFGTQHQLGRMVYMKNCLHCHGVSGDGHGPTAQYLNPKPRDYRLGIFKFTSTLSAERAARDDLHRIVKNGIPGTYMPSFLLMKEDETTAVVEYIRWLALRGEMEKRLGDELSDFNEPSIKSASKKANEEYEEATKKGEKPEKPVSASQALAVAKESFAKYEREEFPGIVDETADFLAETWKRADDEASRITPKVARVADTQESRRRGRLLYMSNRTKCYTCHGPLGRGDGGNVDDFWPKPGSNEKYAERGLFDLWGNKLQPRDLTKGQYRGGRRPLDLYRRVFAGIKGTPMPAFGGTVLKDDEIWDLVNYVMSLPFESPTPSTPRPAAMAAMPPEND